MTQDDERPRTRLFTINPRVFPGLMGKRITFYGLPSDATFVRAWYDHRTNRCKMIYSHPSFSPGLEDVCPFDEHFVISAHHTVVTEHDTICE
jgi:hypothetical protein